MMQHGWSIPLASMFQVMSWEVILCVTAFCFYGIWWEKKAQVKPMDIEQPSSGQCNRASVTLYMRLKWQITFLLNKAGLCIVAIQLSGCIKQHKATLWLLGVLHAGRGLWFRGFIAQIKFSCSQYSCHPACFLVISRFLTQQKKAQSNVDLSA